MKRLQQIHDSLFSKASRYFQILESSLDSLGRKLF